MEFLNDSNVFEQFEHEDADKKNKWINIYIQNKIQELNIWETKLKQREEQVRKHEEILEERLRALDKN